MNKLNAQNNKHDEQDQLAVLSREIKFKKVVFSELVSDFVAKNINAKTWCWSF